MAHNSAPGRLGVQLPRPTHQNPQFDFTGHPAISVLCGKSEGLPIGMMLVGKVGDDATVLRAADAWQRKFGEGLSLDWIARRAGAATCRGVAFFRLTYFDRAA
jgi:Asp-tRNA(Asn)/Glu-tRNA(Gln) amidotransferase A subunit family amidase